MGFPGFGLFHCFGVHHQTLCDMCQSTESNNKMICVSQVFYDLGGIIRARAFVLGVVLYNWNLFWLPLSSLSTSLFFVSFF